jgi:penicillin-binding protein 1A
MGIGRALLRNIQSHGVQEGGSTITQQLARNIFLSSDRSFQRKVKEALLALKLEQQLTKDQILELYLNNIYFGEGAYGVGAASQIYFGKPPQALNQAECALLAGLPQAPSLYSPFANPTLALKRRNEVLDNMAEDAKLPAHTVQQLKQMTLHLNPTGRSDSAADKAPFFNRYVMGDVLALLDMDEQTFWQQGLKIYTTLDPRAQRIADLQVRSLSAAFGRTGRKQQAALLSLDNEGRMIAYVGGKDFRQSQFDRVSQAHRQAGSLFKLFVYTTAMMQGVSPLTVYKDAPVTFGPWTPHNYDQRHHGYMTLAEALIHSNNVVAVKLLNDLSPGRVIETAEQMGVESLLSPNLSLALGSSEVTLKEMTGAFSVLCNNGQYVPPYAIEKIVDRSGRILYQHRPSQQRVMDRSARDTMVGMLQGVVRLGTGRAATFGRDMAGKTGTSDDYRDAWFIGFTPDITTGVWVGNDDNSRMPGITGGSIPARIWRAYMSKLLARFPHRRFNLENAAMLNEKDFYTYNMENLSASEDPSAATDQDDSPEEVEIPPEETGPNTDLPMDEKSMPPSPEPLGEIPGEPAYTSPPPAPLPLPPAENRFAPSATSDRESRSRRFEVDPGIKQNRLQPVPDPMRSLHDRPATRPSPPTNPTALPNSP